MHPAQLVELEYLNGKLYQAQAVLLRLQPLLSPAFKQAVVCLSTKLPPLVQAADRDCRAIELARRDLRLRQLGLTLGDLVAVDEDRGAGWRFRLENAEFDLRTSLFSTLRSRAPLEVFKLIGSMVTPGKPRSRQPVVFMVETARDAQRVRSVLRPLGQPPAPPAEPLPPPIATFLTDLRPSQVAAWCGPAHRAVTADDRDAAARLFYPRGLYWDDVRHKHYRPGDLAAIALQVPVPLMDVTGPLYAEGRRLETDDRNTRLRTVRRLMMLESGTILDVAYEGEPMWVRVREIRAHETGVCIEGERVVEDTAPWPVKLVVSGIGQAERVRERSGLTGPAAERMLRRVRRDLGVPSA